MKIGRAIGKGIAFPPRIGPEGGWAWSEGDENVTESIRVILSTEPRERLFRPEFGAGLRAFLFQPNTVSTRQHIADRMERALSLWEPRIRVESISVEADPGDPESAIATLRYRLVATQVSQTLTLGVRLGS